MACAAVEAASVLPVHEDWKNPPRRFVRTSHLLSRSESGWRWDSTSPSRALHRLCLGVCLRKPATASTSAVAGCHPGLRLGSLGGTSSRFPQSREARHTALEDRRKMSRQPLSDV